MQIAMAQLLTLHFLTVWSSCTVEFDNQSKHTRDIALAVALCTASLVPFFCSSGDHYAAFPLLPPGRASPDV